MLEQRRNQLKAVLNDPDLNVRQAAATALERLETMAELEQLLEAVKGANRGVRVQAIYSLERIHSEQIYPVLLEALEDQDADIRAATVQVLGSKKHRNSLGPLVKHLKDPSPAVQVHVADALGQFADPRLVPYLGAVLKSKDDALVCSAAKAIRTIGVATGEPLLLPLLKDSRPRVREAAVEALGLLGI